MEVIILKVFSFCNHKLVPFVLFITVIAGLFSLIYAMVLRLLRKKAFKSSFLRQVGKELNFLARKGVYYSFVFVALTFVLYTVIFTWSIAARRTVPTESEYVEALYSRSDWEQKPISTKMNLIGDTHDQINTIFGEARRKDGNRETYKGVIDDEKDYEVTLVFLPGLNRVIWYMAGFRVG